MTALLRYDAACRAIAEANTVDEVTDWIDRYHQLWESRFDALEKVVEELKQKEMIDGRKKR